MREACSPATLPCTQPSSDDQASGKGPTCRFKLALCLIRLGARPAPLAPGIPWEGSQRGCHQRWGRARYIARSAASLHDGVALRHQVAAVIQLLHPQHSSAGEAWPRHRTRNWVTPRNRRRLSSSSTSCSPSCPASDTGPGVGGSSALAK